MITNKLIFDELRKGTKYGCNLLVKKFYEPSRRTLTAYFKIQYCDTDPIVNEAMEKIIYKVGTIEFTSEGEFSSYVKKTVINTALDFLKKKKQRKEINIEEIQPLAFKNIKSEINSIEIDDDEKQKIILGEEKFDELDDEVEEDLVDPDFDITNVKAEIEFLYDSDIVKENEKVLFIKGLFDSFSLEEQFYLRLYLNNVPHKEIARIKRSNPSATRKYINRLFKTLIQRASEKVNKNFNEIYEKFKKQNK